MDEPRYPDITDILDRKAQGRLDMSRRSFGEKIEAIEALRERLRPFAVRRAARAKHLDTPRGRTGMSENTGEPTLAPPD